MKINYKIVLLVTTLIICFQALAHPGGNMITVGEHVLWSYVSPIDDTQHHAVVMIWRPGAEPEILLKSEFVASDYFFYANGSSIYIIEQRYIQRNDTFEIRVLKTRIGEQPIVMWDWFTDRWRIGDGGFFMKSEQEIVFGRYPDLYCLKRGQNPEKFMEFEAPVKRIRAIDNNLILLLGDNSCWLANRDGKIIRIWSNLLDVQIKDAPLNRNQIFDADYKDGELLLAYWGNRSFDVFNSKGVRKTLMQMQAPQVPHWVAFYGTEKLLFSSRLDFSGAAPTPNFILYTAEDEKVSIWKK